MKQQHKANRGIAGSFFRFLATKLLLWRYKINRLGQLPKDMRGTLVVANHQSYIDGIIMAWLLPRGTHFMVLPDMFQLPVLGYVLKKAGAIPFGGTIGQNKRGIEQTREILANGGTVCIFAEGSITRTGQLRPFRRGIEVIAEDLDINILPVYIHGFFGGLRKGSKFSFSEQKFFCKRSGFKRRKITLHVGQPLAGTTPAWKIRQNIAWLGSIAMSEHLADNETAARRFLSKAQDHPFSKVMADSTGTQFNYMKLAIGARLLAKHLAETADDKTIGVLLPGAAGAVLTNLAIAFTGRAVVNLNFSLGKASMESAIQQAGIERVVTSRLFLKKIPEYPNVNYLYLEDFRKKVGGMQRLFSLLAFWLLPSPILKRHWLKNQLADNILTIQFSSGSTAEPKGVCLTNRQILCNVSSFGALLQQVPKQPMLGILPLFHAFGYTVCQWYCLLNNNRVFFHPNPLEFKTVAEHIEKQHIGIIVATPTFAAGYARSGSLKSVNLVVCGGEKLAPKMATILHQKLPNTHILEGYGASELGPVAAVNMPDYKSKRLTQVGHREKSVGMPIPGVAVKIVDPETMQELAPTEQGLILIHSAARMQGYLNKPSLTGQVLHNGWYNTGDIGYLDSDGFLFLTDRQSRFSKIGGEMVPHGKIEQTLQDVLEHQEVAVVPDTEDKIHVLYADKKSPAELFKALKESDLPKLWQPKQSHYHQLKEIPRMATGKLDLKACKERLKELSQ